VRRAAAPGRSRHGPGFSPAQAAPEPPKVEPWQYAPIQEEQRRNATNIIPPQFRPRVVMRYGDAKDLLVSGLLDGGTDLAQRPMVVDVPLEKGTWCSSRTTHLARRDAGQLFPGVQRAAELR
jgi:hypothetical protein